ncbi:MotA/TolQ/ExbB proton channel family protein [Methylocaldum szegediense]|jgi:biopolymer transport protein ExbB|uniref:Biopolymer transport protein ExbB n=1 Tax=Methylocaldum szegediense TaxID=73780 RepID=A0ABN8XAD5_9GAMM|nr:MotA/TolQ/ExbB proton channel family protein [Methylocaldum szegediense]CAI8923523.1 biopolymer transport protein ExbB [Methylocaldum szegediense]
MIHLSSADIVQITLWVLIAFSIITWSIIFFKSWTLWNIGKRNRGYSKAFWAAPDLAAASSLEHATSALGRIAGAGFGVLKDVRSNTSRMLEWSGDIQSVLERSLRQQISKERKDLEQGLSMLASIGSTSPFVGLFGTVWGIMHALKDISEAKSASLDVVAGPIGEALIATAIGIAAAIPAVLAYNFFLRRIKLCEADLEYFATDFLNLAVKTGLKGDGSE